MTMDILPEHVQHIAQKLETEPVTYNGLSRELGIHVTKAKLLLASYYAANKSRVSASFLLSGTRKGQIVLKLFESDVDLQENHHIYVDSVNCVHIYCLTLTKNSFSPSEIALYEMRHPLNGDPKVLGVTIGPPLVPVKGVGSRAVKSEKEATKPGIAAETKGKTEKTPQKESEKPEKPKLVYQSRKQQPEASVLSNYVSRKGEKSEKNAPAKRPAQTTPKFEYKSRKLEANQPKERVVISNVESHDLDEEAAPKNQPSHADLQNLFMDDFSDEDISETADLPEKNEPIIVEESAPETENKQQEDENEKADGDTGDSEDKNEEQPDEEFEKESILSALPIKTTEDPVEPVASETIVDDEGYFTSYKQMPKQTPKPELKATPVRLKAKPSPKVANASKPKTGKDGKKQTSLMNFFGKR